MKKSKIRVIATSIRGPLHMNKQLPCQDCYKYSTRGKNFVAVVSDGAGSAKFAQNGAKIVCETLIDLLKNSSFKNAKQNIKKAIKIARERLELHRLNKSKSQQGIMDFAATVVGVIYHNEQGLFFHIGDGAALALHNGEYDKFVASPPENGNFSCETFFYTQPDWEHKLRFTSFEKADCIFLMSDGITGFAFNNDYTAIDKGFILPINKFLSDSEQKIKAQRALTNTLNNEKAKKINSDDKTLLWARL